MGNRCVLVASEPYPLAATDFYQVLDTSDVPGGVVNILTGSHDELAPTLAGHMDVDAVWSFSSSDLSAEIERQAAGTSNGPGSTTAARATGLAPRARAATFWRPPPRSRRSGCPTARVDPGARRDGPAMLRRHAKMRAARH